MTPGLRYLLRILPSLLGPPSILYLFLNLTKNLTPTCTRFLPYWLSSTTVCLLVAVVRLQWKSWTQRYEVRRLGASEVPTYSGNWPGNLDGVLALAQSMNTGYIGTEDYFTLVSANRTPY